MNQSPESAKPLLVIMAAGLGSRFGGVKQLARVGPEDEAFLDLSIKDGLAAGFGEIVLIVRSDIEADVREQITAQHGDLGVHYVRQDDLGPPRDKPWGTLHAVLSAVDVIDRPYAVINADDYYGPQSFVLGAKCMDRLGPGVAANVAFQMGRTVPPSGSVTRAVTEVEHGHLTAIVETDECQRLADGTFSANGQIVPGETPVSMNFWCFHHSIIGDFEERWQTFLAANQDQPKAEAQLPTIVGELMADDRLKVEVVSSPEQWIGITNPEDFELAKAALASR
ncbi:MAG: nucleotidyltransferase family protein [Acidimicrobiales bacterium]